MSLTLAPEGDELIVKSDTDQQSQASHRQFCSTCFTDRVAVLGGGLVYCVDCSRTTDPWELG